jgi:hypothetical protein
MASNTFALNFYSDFHKFALLRHESVSQLSKLLIRADHTFWSDPSHNWSKVLISSILGCFENLQEVTLVLFMLTHNTTSLLHTKDVVRSAQ